MKWKIYLVLFISLFFRQIVMGRGPITANPDSFIKILNSTKSDTTKAEIAYLLSEYYFKNNDSVNAKNYLNNGKHYAKGNPMWLAISGYYSTILTENQNHEAAEKAYLTTEKTLEPFNNNIALSYRAMCWYNYGVLQQYKDDQKGFIEILLNKALPLAEKSGDSFFIGKTYWGLGIVFKNTQQYERSEVNFIKAIDIFKSLHIINPNTIKSYINLAEAYILEGKYTEANQALNETQNYLVSENASPDMWILYYTSRGMYYTVTQKYNLSESEINKGITLTEKIGDSFQKGRLMMQLFYAQFNGKKFNEALNTLSFLCKDSLITSQIVNRLQIYEGYAQTYANLNDFQNAYNWKVKYSTLSDSVYESKLKTDISALEVKFKNAENEKRITQLENDKKTAKLAAKSKNNIILFLIIGCTLLVIIAIIGWSSYQKSQNISQQKEQLHQQRLQQKEQEIHLSSIQSLLEGEEKERTRIARDLHDGLGGMLASIKLKMSHVASENQWDIANDKLSKISVPLDNALEELRRISRNMVSPTLLRFGLESAINDLCQSLNRACLSIEFQSFDIKNTIPENDQLMIYRIVQELLTNALKHAQATKIIVQCSQNEQTFFITVEDNGVGFDPKSTEIKGIGLTNLEHRIHYMNGKMLINTELGKGSVFDIELKINKI